MSDKYGCCREVTPQELENLNKEVSELKKLVEILKQDYIERKLPIPKFKAGDKVIYTPNPIGKTRIETEILDISPRFDLGEWLYWIYIFENNVKVSGETLTLNNG